jgi:hypothetical protein
LPRGLTIVFRSIVVDINHQEPKKPIIYREDGVSLKVAIRQVLKNTFSEIASPRDLLRIVTSQMSV